VGVDVDELSVEPELDVLASLAVVATGVSVATAPTPPVTGPESERGISFEPRAFAAARYSSKVFPVVGALIVPTIPRPQWTSSLQK